MSWSRRSALAALACLAGCGFTPVYGPGGAGTALRDQVLVDAPTTPMSFALNRKLEESLGRNPGAGFGLSYTLTTATDDLAITSDQEIQRFHLTGLVEYQLKDRGTGAVVASGQVENFTAFSATGSTVDTTTAERDAEQRLAVILADALITRLIAKSAELGL